MTRRLAPGALRALLRHPTMLPAAARSALALAPTGWWRRPPFLPLPPAAYWRFRLETAAGGDGTTAPDADELVEVVAWSSRMRKFR